MGLPFAAAQIRADNGLGVTMLIVLEPRNISHTGIAHGDHALATLEYRQTMRGYDLNADVIASTAGSAQNITVLVISMGMRLSRLRGACGLWWLAKLRCRAGYYRTPQDTAGRRSFRTSTSVHWVENDHGEIDPQGEIAPYLQLAGILRRQIETGQLPPGARLLSVVRLAERYNVARVTAHKAARLLVDEGLVVVSPGRGMFVRRDRAS